MSIDRFPTTLPVPFSKVVRAGGFLFLSGVVAMDKDGQIVEGDITAQTRLVLARINETLAERGASMADVIRATVWLSNLSDFDAFNAEYGKHFTDGLPSRSAVQAGLYPGALVEIEVQAFDRSAA